MDVAGDPSWIVKGGCLEPDDIRYGPIIRRPPLKRSTLGASRRPVHDDKINLTSPGDRTVSLDELAAFLTSVSAPDGCMDLSELDGFLAGLACGPVAVPADEWLAEVFGDDEPAYEDDTQKRAVLNAILAHYATIDAALDTSPLTYAPILWQDSAGVTVTEDWAAGFMRAVSLRPAEWRPALADDDASLLLIPIASLAQSVVPEDARGRSLPDEVLDGLMEDAERVLPVCVLGLRRFWQSQGPAAGAVRH